MRSHTGRANMPENPFPVFMPIRPVTGSLEANFQAAVPHLCPVTESLSSRSFVLNESAETFLIGRCGLWTRLARPKGVCGSQPLCFWTAHRDMKSSCSWLTGIGRSIVPCCNWVCKKGSRGVKPEESPPDQQQVTMPDVSRGHRVPFY